MLNSPVLEVAIGMVFFYLLLSLIVSALGEMIEAWLKNRARDLESGIRRLLDNEVEQPSGLFTHVRNKILQLFNLYKAPQKPAGLATELYNHALVRGLYLERKDLPSYIPARNFALALLDLVGAAKGATADLAIPREERAAIVQAMRAKVVEKFPDGKSPEVKTALLALIDAANDDPVQVRKNIEDWYNSSMDRVSGWYKRRTQVIVLALGFLVAIVTNADSVIVFDALWKDSDLRSGVVQAAIKSSADTSSAARQIDQGQGVKDEASGPKPKLAAHELREQSQEQLSTLNLPIGWRGQDLQHTAPSKFRENPGQYFWDTVYQVDAHWLGWLLTGLAISLGAPFWFDLLNKIIVVRSTVKPQEKSQNEGSKS